MDYREQANLMQRDAEEFDGPGYIIGDLRQGAKSITDLLARAEAAEARADLLAQELKAHSESDLAKAHDLLSADWAKQKMRADRAEKVIVEIEEALKFGRVSAAMLRIFEHRGRKEE